MRLIVILTLISVFVLIGFNFYQNAHKTLDPYKIFNLVNNYRINNGLKPLSMNSELCKFASIRLQQIHSDYSHTGFDQSRNKYPFQYMGENIAAGNYNSEQDLVNAWINSPEHKANILDKTATQTCITDDYYDKSTTNDFVVDYSVQEFASY